MVIRNKKIIGIISLLVGLAILGYAFSIINIVFYGKKSEAVVSGFVVHQNGARKVPNENSSFKNPFRGRSPFVTFRTENGLKTESHSRVMQIFSFTGYHQNNKVQIVYNPENPKQIFILDAREIPGLLLFIVFGFLLMVVGKSYILQKNTK